MIVVPNKKLLFTNRCVQVLDMSTIRRRFKLDKASRYKDKAALYEAESTSMIYEEICNRSFYAKKIKFFEHNL